ncbi:DUF6134 family protein [Yeosuana sp.]|uniref:DUF6134 family protein n=1 Tax=Yeosuana sp. TaxID=2529388 RepID=UPI004054C3AC
MLIILLIIKFEKIFKRSYSITLIEVFKRFVFKFKYVLPFLLLSNSNDTTTEVENITFNIINKNTEIGFINIQKTFINQITTYNVDSEVNAKVIFNFNAIGREKSIYKEDTLIYSSLYRKLNDKENLNQSLSFNDGKYILKIKNKKEILHFEVINRNLVTLFFFEPVGITTIYCDKQNQMLNISSLGHGIYKVVFSKNNFNIYHYENGKCVMIEVEGCFFKAVILPTSY